RPGSGPGRIDESVDALAEGGADGTGGGEGGAPDKHATAGNGAGSRDHLSLGHTNNTRPHSPPRSAALNAIVRIGIKIALSAPSRWREPPCVGAWRAPPHRPQRSHASNSPTIWGSSAQSKSIAFSSAVLLASSFASGLAAASI